MAQWRFVLCERSGVEIANLTAVASDKAFTYRMLLATKLAFSLPADSDVSRVHTDGYPILDSGRRIIKAYRQPDSGGAYALKFAGPVWTCLDVGDENTAKTMVECYDPLIQLNRRFALDATANGYSLRTRIVEFTNTDGIQIAKTLVDRTNALAPSMVTTTGATVETSPVRTVKYERRTVYSAIYELASAFNGFDYRLTPLDSETGIHGRLDFLARLGTNRPEAAFGWDMPPHNVKRVERKMDMERVANTILALGATNTGGGGIERLNEDAISTTQFGRYEDIEVFSDITIQSFLDALATDAINFRARRRELVQFVPQPGTKPEPFVDFDIGDTVPVYIGERLRGGALGLQRVYGFDLVIDSEGRELVNGVYVAPN